MHKGTIGIGNTTENVCPYAVNVFDLQTNRRLRRYELRPEDTNANTFIANTAVDIGASCEGMICNIYLVMDQTFYAFVLICRYVCLLLG